MSAVGTTVEAPPTLALSLLPVSLPLDHVQATEAETAEKRDGNAVAEERKVTTNGTGSYVLFVSILLLLLFLSTISCLSCWAGDRTDFVATIVLRAPKPPPLLFLLPKLWPTPPTPPTPPLSLLDARRAQHAAVVAGWPAHMIVRTLRML